MAKIKRIRITITPVCLPPHTVNRAEWNYQLRVEIQGKPILEGRKIVDEDHFEDYFHYLMMEAEAEIRAALKETP